MQLFKDWVIDVLEQELSRNFISRFIIQSISQAVKNKIENIERTAISMNQERYRDEITPER